MKELYSIQHTLQRNIGLVTKVILLRTCVIRLEKSRVPEFCISDFLVIIIFFVSLDIIFFPAIVDVNYTSTFASFATFSTIGLLK